VLAVSGLVISHEDVIYPAVDRWTQTPARPRNPASVPIPGATPLTAERAVEIARAAMPGAMPHNINVITGPKSVYGVGLRFPEDLTSGARSFVTIDQFSGTVLFTQNSRTVGGSRRLGIVNRALHTGDIAGIPSKIAAALTCLAVLVQVVTGVYLWWKKRKLPARSVQDVEAQLRAA
jgi:uncharacterized iron-regulated membrane protein